MHCLNGEQEQVADFSDRILISLRCKITRRCSGHFFLITGTEHSVQRFLRKFRAHRISGQLTEQQKLINVIWYRNPLLVEVSGGEGQSYKTFRLYVQTCYMLILATGAAYMPRPHPPPPFTKKREKKTEGGFKSR